MCRVALNSSRIRFVRGLAAHQTRVGATAIRGEITFRTAINQMLPPPYLYPGSCPASTRLPSPAS
jgi:hypothetical protein